VCDAAERTHVPTEIRQLGGHRAQNGGNQDSVMHTEVVSLTRVLNAVAADVPKQFRPDSMIARKEGDISDQLDFKERQATAAALLYQSFSESEGRLAVFDSRKVGIPTRNPAAYEDVLNVLVSVQDYLAEAKKVFLSLTFAHWSQFPAWWWKPSYTTLADQLGFERLSLLSWLDGHGIANDESQLIPELVSLNTLPSLTSSQGTELGRIQVEQLPAQIEFDVEDVSDWMAENGVRSPERNQEPQPTEAADETSPHEHADAIRHGTPKDPKYDDVLMRSYIQRNERGESWEEIALELGVTRQRLRTKVDEFKERDEKEHSSPFRTSVFQTK
jgi:hypothetical protein